MARSILVAERSAATTGSRNSTRFRTAQDLLNALPTAAALTAEQQSATSGYLKTMQAFSFLLILDTHTQDSIPITVGTEVTAPPQPFVTNAEAFAHVEQLLDQAQTELAAGGAAFPFALPAGFTGFDTPATFTQFNRALRARVSVYQNQFADALTALAGSFINPAGALSLGVYMDYGTGAGDFANTLAIDPQNGENFVHPSIQTGAQLKLDGTPDNRFLTKTIARPSQSADNLTSALGWVRYPAPNTPVPIIKNEELILLRAEANIGLGDLASALTDINTVRTISGGLAPLAGFADATTALTELLYNKTYSLLYEGGHRWIDARHYGRLSTLPIDRPGGCDLLDLADPERGDAAEIVSTDATRRRRAPSGVAGARLPLCGLEHALAGQLLLCRRRHG